MRDRLVEPIQVTILQCKCKIQIKWQAVLGVTYVILVHLPEWPVKEIYLVIFGDYMILSQERLSDPLVPD